MLFLLSAVAAAVSSPQAEPVKAAENDPVVCTRPRSASVVGTHMRPKKVCMKKSDWDYQERHTQRELQQLKQLWKDPGRAEGDRPNVP